MVILYLTSLANLVVKVGTKHCHQILLVKLDTNWLTVAWWILVMPYEDIDVGQ